MKPNQATASRREPIHGSEPNPSFLHNGELSRLLSAAVVSRSFCALLLNNPSQALTTGYNGDTFRLLAEEIALLESIRAATLPEFAERILTLAHTAAERATTPTDQVEAAALLSASVKVRL